MSAMAVHDWLWIDFLVHAASNSQGVLSITTQVRAGIANPDADAAAKAFAAGLQAGHDQRDADSTPRPHNPGR
jgi:hypothetical protein